jgi:predicted ABC-type ATPase
MAARKKIKAPRCIVIAGPNGAGKTTFAKGFLPKVAKVIHFVNADSIAAGISPLKPEMAALAAGRLFLSELDRLSQAHLDFAFESTLSGIAHADRLRRIKDLGYQIDIHYLKLNSEKLALNRIAARVKQGGHFVPKADVIRRFERSWRNFEKIYKQLADFWAVYDNSGSTPNLLQSGLG